MVQRFPPCALPRNLDKNLGACNCTPPNAHGGNLHNGHEESRTPIARIQVLIKLSRNMARQKSSRFAQVQLKIGPMALDKLLE